MDFSRPLAGLDSRHMWDSIPICASLSLPYSPSFSELGCLLSLQPNSGIQSWDHHFVLSLVNTGRFRAPRSDVGSTRPISKGWSASTKPYT